MVSDNSTNIRLESVERSVLQLTARVGEVATFMERLVSIEERNGFMNQKHDELKESIKESIAALSAKNAALEEKVGKLQEKMIRMLAIFSVVTGIAAFAAPYLVKALMASGVPA